MQLDEMVQWLIGVGASMGADCQPCLQTCIAMARQCGADEEQVDTAAAVGMRVRECAEKRGKPAETTNASPDAAESESTTCCGNHVTHLQKERSE